MKFFTRQATPEIGVEELDALLHGHTVRLLDVREEWEYRRGRVPGALNVPLGQLPGQVAGLPKDLPYAVICQTGSRSVTAADFLIGNGFDGTVSVRGGTSAWSRANLPLDRG